MPRTQAFYPKVNEERLRAELDLLEERRDEANLKAAAYRQRVKHFYDKKVKQVTFQIGDLVLRTNKFDVNKSRVGKLIPNWEGPYIVQEIIRPGTYWLTRMNGKKLKRPYHSEYLRSFKRFDRLAIVPPREKGLKRFDHLALPLLGNSLKRFDRLAITLLGKKL
ncbi:hypothetical protein J5N97_017304 [Dioscorea zingiberensis]|uniref:Reverse transcriptase domain-containing protein n=1 Tax=Dioscorea zingiberensis TaxID=325984 RepID=A0A9D5CM45_9LILI|nr:hypothetical protein J5N97_017304 [Dioscorea zingiberensis]